MDIVPSQNVLASHLKCGRNLLIVDESPCRRIVLWATRPDTQCSRGVEPGTIWNRSCWWSGQNYNLPSPDSKSSTQTSQLHCLPKNLETVSWTHADIQMKGLHLPHSRHKHKCLQGKMSVSLISLIQMTHSKPVSSKSYSSSCNCNTPKNPWHEQFEIPTDFTDRRKTELRLCRTLRKVVAVGRAFYCGKQQRVNIISSM